MNAKNFHDEQQDYQEKAIANIINIFDDFKKNQDITAHSTPNDHSFQPKPRHLFHSMLITYKLC